MLPGLLSLLNEVASILEYGAVEDTESLFVGRGLFPWNCAEISVNGCDRDCLRSVDFEAGGCLADLLLAGSGQTSGDCVTVLSPVEGLPAFSLLCDDFDAEENEGLRDAIAAAEVSNGNRESNDGLEISREIFLVEAPLLVPGLDVGALLPRPNMLNVNRGGMGATATSNADIVS